MSATPPPPAAIPVTLMASPATNLPHKQTRRMGAWTHHTGIERMLSSAVGIVRVLFKPGVVRNHQVALPPLV